MLGGIIGYALLPKIITEAIPEYVAGVDSYPGLGKEAFTITVRKGMFVPYDIIAMDGLEKHYLLEHDGGNYLMGRLLDNGKTEYVKVELKEEKAPEPRVEYDTEGFWQWEMLHDKCYDNKGSEVFKIAHTYHGD